MIRATGPILSRLTRTGIAVVLTALLAGAACAQQDAATSDAAAPAPQLAAPAVPEAVNGWREYPLRDGVVSIQPKWRTDVVDVPVPAGEGREYKVTM